MGKLHINVRNVICVWQQQSEWRQNKKLPVSVRLNETNLAGGSMLQATSYEKEKKKVQET